MNPPPQYIVDNLMPAGSCQRTEASLNLQDGLTDRLALVGGVEGEKSADVEKRASNKACSMES